MIFFYEKERKVTCADSLNVSGEGFRYLIMKTDILMYIFVVVFVVIVLLCFTYVYITTQHWEKIFEI